MAGRAKVVCADCGRASATPGERPDVFGIVAEIVAEIDGRRITLAHVSVFPMHDSYCDRAWPMLAHALKQMGEDLLIVDVHTDARVNTPGGRD